MSDRGLLQQALEALDYMHQEKCDYMRRNNLGDPLREDAARLALPAITALRTRLAQPEPEPVGWLESPYGEFRRNPLWQLDPNMPRSLRWAILLYAAPQYRQWVDLTKDEVIAALKDKNT